MQHIVEIHFQQNKKITNNNSNYYTSDKTMRYSKNTSIHYILQSRHFDSLFLSSTMLMSRSMQYVHERKTARRNECCIFHITLYIGYARFLSDIVSVNSKRLLQVRYLLSRTLFFLLLRKKCELLLMVYIVIKMKLF